MNKTDFNTGWTYGHAGEEQHPVTLPHDAMLYDGRSAEEPTGSAGAFFKAGCYEYEKEFDVPQDAADRKLILQFEGVMRNAHVCVNGREAGGAAYGYIPFWIELTDFIRPGERNTIRVTADNSRQPASRWYTGGGIYRPVWLWEGPCTFIQPQGLRVKTLSYRTGEIEVKVLADGVKMPLCAAVEILDERGSIVASQDIAITDMAGKTALTIPDAKLWDEKSPYLYTCRASILSGGTVIDTAQTSFGIRTIETGPDGLLINGNQTLLRGGSVHHDHGVIGSVTTPESEWRRIRKLKEAGFNALRIAHNPACEALLEAADHYGMYIIDETWDMWYSHKSRYDYASDFSENYQSDISEMVSRDFSHPSVIMYSIGNEVSEPATEKGVKLGKEIIDLFHSLDSSRPVTAGINIMILSQSAKGSGVYDEEGGRDTSSEEKTKAMSSTMFNVMASVVGTSMNRMGNSKKADAVSTPILDALDVCGYNYGSGRYPLEAKAHPGRVVYGSEIFPQDVAKNWAVIKKYPYLIGDFPWTAWDYMGECGAGAWGYDDDGKGFEKPYPWKLADAGLLDILGDPNAELFWAQAAWGVLKGVRVTVQPVNHPGVTPAKSTWRGTNGLPSWSWHGCSGNKAIVEVFTPGTHAELYLNGKKIGRRRVKNCRAVFRTSYAPGELKAVAYNASGKKIGEDVLRSAADALHLDTQVRKEPVPDTQSFETIYVELSVCDGNGITEMNRNITLHASVSGAELLGFGSANPRTEEDFTAGIYTTWYGRALAVVRKEKGAQAQLLIEEENGTDPAFRCNLQIE